MPPLCCTNSHYLHLRTSSIVAGALEHDAHVNSAVSTSGSYHNTEMYFPMCMLQGMQISRAAALTLNAGSTGARMQACMQHCHVVRRRLADLLWMV